MLILAHRGLWSNGAPQNSLSAIQKAFDKDYGLETDIRDHNGQLVISHDPPNNVSQSFTRLLDIYAKSGGSAPLALNIKADGLDNLIIEALSQQPANGYFTFDMSVPQMVVYHKKGIRFFTRHSDFESVPAMYGEAAGVWLDSFEEENWIEEHTIMAHLERGKQVCLVSPELHRRSHEVFWKKLKDFRMGHRHLMLCTDLPDEAAGFFNEYSGGGSRI